MVTFIMFQGGGTSQESWNYGEGKFMDKLKKLGKICNYSNKVYGVFGYHKDFTKTEQDNYDKSLDFNIDYLNLHNYIDDVYETCKDYPKPWVPVAWSAGGYPAVAFAKKHKCAFIVLLDSVMFTQTFINDRIKKLKAKISHKINPKLIVDLIGEIKTKQKTVDILELNTIAHLMWTIDFKGITKKPTFPCSTISFSNIILNDKKDVAFTNKLRNLETKKLLEYNKNYYNINIIDGTHCVFQYNDNTILIINNIKSMIEKYNRSFS